MSLTIDWGVVLMMVATLSVLALYALWPTLRAIARVVAIVWQRRAQLMKVATMMSQKILDGKMDQSGAGAAGAPVTAGGLGRAASTEGVPPTQPSGPIAANRRGRRAMRLPR